MSELVRRFADLRDSAGLFLDFDGTLSNIARTPSEARPAEGAREVLEALSRTFRSVVVVSGRSAHDLLGWLGPSLEIWGLHGAERTEDGRVELSARAQPYTDMMKQVLEEAAVSIEQAALPGVVLEDKGVMVGLHYRAATEPGQAERELTRIAEELRSRHGLLLAEGKLAIELRPPVAFSKQQVVLDRAREEGLSAAAFVGDDVVDLPGFDALDELAAEGVLGLRVAVDSKEAPPELIARADVVVPGPAGTVEFLNGLVALAGG